MDAHIASLARCIFPCEVYLDTLAAGMLHLLPLPPMVSSQCMDTGVRPLLYSGPTGQPEPVQRRHHSVYFACGLCSHIDKWWLGNYLVLVNCCRQRALLIDRLVGFKIMYSSVKSLHVSNLVERRGVFLCGWYPCPADPRSFIFIYYLVISYFFTILPRTHRNFGLGNVSSTDNSHFGFSQLPGWPLTPCLSAVL